MLVSVRVICGKVIEVEAIDPSGGAPLTCMVGPRARERARFERAPTLDHAERQRLGTRCAAGSGPSPPPAGRCTGARGQLRRGRRALAADGARARIGADAQLDLENYCESTYALVRRESLEHAKRYRSSSSAPPPSSSPAAGAALESPAPDRLWPQLQANDAPHPDRPAASCGGRPRGRRWTRGSAPSRMTHCADRGIRHAGLATCRRPAGPYRPVCCPAVTAIDVTEAAPIGPGHSRAVFTYSRTSPPNLSATSATKATETYHESRARGRAR